MYSFPGNLTCRTELTVRSHDENFFDTVIDILQGSNSIESSVSVKNWSRGSDGSLFAYIAIIVFHEEIVAKFHPEALSQMISDVILNITQTNDSMLMTQKILVCKRSDTSTIDGFSEAYGLEVDLKNLEADIGYWSMFLKNSLLSSGFKPSHRHTKLQ